LFSRRQTLNPAQIAVRENTAKAEALLKAKLSQEVFNKDQANSLFRARAQDNGTIVEDNALKRF
jgi:hypothetical protein